MRNSELFPEYEHSNWRWPLLVMPLEGEAFSSWVTRVAEVNGGSLQSLCWATWPGRDLLMKDLDRSIPQEVIATLRNRTGQSTNSLRALSLQSLEGVLFEDCGDGSARLPWVLPVHLRKPNSHGVQFCPDCLGEDRTPYFRLNWRLSFLTCCRTHSRLLLDHCPSCERALNPYVCFGGLRRNTGPVPVHLCRWCGWDLRRTSPVAGDINMHVEAPVIPFQGELECAIRDGWVLRPGGEWLHSIPWFRGLQRLIRHLSSGGATKRLRLVVQHEMGIPADPVLEEFTQQAQLFEQLPVTFRHHTIHLLGWILEDWPHRLIRACKSAHLRHARLLMDSTQPAPFWLWSVVQEHLSMKYQRWRNEILPPGLTISYRELGERLTNEGSLLRERRIRFIREHPELCDDLLCLIRRMKAEGLYSPHSETSILLKHIEPVITRAMSRMSLLSITE